MTEAEQIVGFLQKNRPKPYCDDCIADELKLASRQKAQRVTEVLGLTLEYRRQKGVCSSCKNDTPKFVVNAILPGTKPCPFCSHS